MLMEIDFHDYDPMEIALHEQDHHELDLYEYDLMEIVEQGLHNNTLGTGEEWLAAAHVDYIEKNSMLWGGALLPMQISYLR